MKLQTTLFGAMEVEEESLFSFENGLYGLEEYKQFALIRPDKSLPFAYLQAVEEPNICLLVADPFVFQPSYEFDIPEQDVRALREPDAESLAVWVTVTAGETLENGTMNLLAPIVINLDQRLGRQVVLHDSGYETKTPLFPRKGAE
jgi:flagellar assembly factor FliW